MRFKLDENLAADLSPPIAAAGYDVATVSGEGLSGCEDQSLYQACRAEDRILVTLDMDFANPMRFLPETAAGTIVLRPPRPLLTVLRGMVAGVLARLKTESIAGKLWIVEPENIRIYEPSPGSSEGQSPQH